MSTIPITVAGNLTADPEMRQTQSGKGVVSFSVASNERRYNRQSGEWEDGDTTFVNVSAWNRLADQCATQLRKGMGVIVKGTLRQRHYQAQDGSNRSAFELTADDVAVSIRNQNVQATRAAGQSAPAQPAPAQPAPAQARPAQAAPVQSPFAAQDPWASPEPAF